MQKQMPGKDCSHAKPVIQVRVGTGTGHVGEGWGQGSLCVEVR